MVIQAVITRWTVTERTNRLDHLPYLIKAQRILNQNNLQTEQVTPRTQATEKVHQRQHTRRRLPCHKHVKTKVNIKSPFYQYFCLHLDVQWKYIPILNYIKRASVIMKLYFCICLFFGGGTSVLPWSQYRLVECMLPLRLYCKENHYIYLS